MELCVERCEVCGQYISVSKNSMFVRRQKYGDGKLTWVYYHPDCYAQKTQTDITTY